jgi:hypothetical protein
VNAGRIFTRRQAFWGFLVFGVLLRCCALFEPVVDAGLLRQTQTAAGVRSLIEEQEFLLTAPIPWIGNLPGRFILEFPLYNYLVAAVAIVVGNLDVSGKLTTITLWAVSFVLLQALWRRILQEREIFWANGLFVLSPLGVFYGQAFMPEPLVQTLAFAFVAATMRYVEKQSLGRWIGCATLGLIALLVKLTAIAHLYLLLVFLIVCREGW